MILLFYLLFTLFLPSYSSSPIQYHVNQNQTNPESPSSSSSSLSEIWYLWMIGGMLLAPMVFCWIWMCLKKYCCHCCYACIDPNDFLTDEQKQECTDYLKKSALSNIDPKGSTQNAQPRQQPICIQVMPISSSSASILSSSSSSFSVSYI